MNTRANNTRKPKKKIIIAVIIAVILFGGGGYALQQSMSGQTLAATQSTVDSTISLETDDENIDWAALPTKEITLSSQALAITSGGTYILTGETTAGVTVNTDANVRIVLSNATIKSSTGAAIYIESADNTVIQLAVGTKNTVEDGSTRSDQTIDGAIYSADDLIFNGAGSLIVTSHFADAVVSKDDLKITSGMFTITSADDAIRGKDSVDILGGTITINAAGDGIKATNDVDATKGYVYIKAGTISIKAGDDAIKGEQKVSVDGGDITIESSVEAIEAALININGGNIKAYASEDGINGSASTLTATPVVTFNGGTTDVTVGPGDTDAIDSNGDVVVTGGTIIVTAPTSSFDYDGTAEMTGGTITVNGEQTTSIPEPSMGGGMRGR